RARRVPAGARPDGAEAARAARARRRAAPQPNGQGRQARAARTLRVTIAAGMTVDQLPGSPRTVVDLLRATAEVQPERLAFVDGDRRITFAGLDRAAGGVAALFAE